MRRLWKTGLLLLLATVCMTVSLASLTSGKPATAANPTTMSFQGKVVNANGTNVTDGTYSFLFKLYTLSSGGTAIWTETQSSVTVTAGVFQVNLGSVCPFFTANACNASTPIDFNANPGLYLGITFNGDPAGEMTPRVQLQSVPFAFNADRVGGLQVSQLAQLSPGTQQTGFINVSGASTFGNGLTVTSGGAAIGGNSSVTGNLAVSNRLNAASTTGTNGQGYFIQNATPSNIAAFQALDLGGNTYSFLATNKYYNGSAWADDGLGRTGSSFQIQNDSFNFYSFDTGTNFTSRFVVASGGNVGIGDNVTPAYKLDVQGGDINTSANLRTGGTIRLDSSGNLTNIANLTMTGTLGVTGNIATTNGNILIQQTAAGASAIFDDSAGKIGSIKAGAAKVAFLFDNTGNFSIGSETRANIAASNTAGTDVLTILGASGNVGIGDTTPAATLTVGNGDLFQVAGATGNITTVGGAAISGAAINLNANSNFAINIGTGTSTGAIDIGGGSNELTINSSAFDVTSAGAVTGVTTLTTSGAINGQTISAAANFTGSVNAVTGYKFNGTAGITLKCNATNNVLGLPVLSGGIVTSATCRNDALSDERLKTDIVPLGDATLDQLKAINPVNFYFDCSNQYFTDSNTYCNTAEQTGVLAQQLMQIFPSLVMQDNYGIYSVNYQGLGIETLKAVSEIAQHLDSQGNATLQAVTADSLTVNGDLHVNGTLSYNALETPTGNFSDTVITPSLVSSGALAINSGSSGDVTIDSGGNSGLVKLGAAEASGVEIARAGATTNIKGALVTDGTTDFNGGVAMHFSDPSTTFRIDSASQPAVFTVAANGDLTTAGALISKGGTFQLLDPTGGQLVSFDQAGNGTFKGDLNLASASLSGGLSVGGDATFAGLSTFQKLATFLGKTIFRQDVEFDGHVSVARDGAGYANLRTGETTVHVSFQDDYAAPPIASASITNGTFAAYTIDHVTASGFDISLQQAATSDTVFSWTAIGVNDPQTASNPPPTTP